MKWWKEFLQTVRRSYQHIVLNSFNNVIGEDEDFFINRSAENRE